MISINIMSAPNYVFPEKRKTCLYQFMYSY